MAAPKGNKNAEKWFLEESESIFLQAIELSNIQERTVLKIGEKAVEAIGYKFDFIGEIARELGYYKSLFTELKNKFPELESMHKQLIENLEANCFCNTKKGNINTAVGIVNLKSNHNWTDRQQTDHTSGGKEINLTPISFVRTKDK